MECAHARAQCPHVPALFLRSGTRFRRLDAFHSLLFTPSTVHTVYRPFDPSPFPLYLLFTPSTVHTVYRPFDPSPFPLYFPSTGIDFLSILIFLLSSFYSSSALFSNLLSNLPQSSSAFLIFSLSLF